AACHKSQIRAPLRHDRTGVGGTGQDPAGGDARRDGRTLERGQGRRTGAALQRVTLTSDLREAPVLAIAPGDNICHPITSGLPGSRPDDFTHANAPSPPRRCACRNARRSGRCPAMANARAQDRDRDAGGRQPGFCQPVARREAQRTAGPGCGGRKFSDNRRGDLEHCRKVAARRLSRQHVDRSFFRARRSRQGAALSSDQGFAFITLISGYPMVVATAPNSPLQFFGDLIARAKAAPFDVTYGMNLPGSVHHLTGELINVEAGTSLRGIPYRGNTQIVQDLLGGRLDVMIETGTIAFAQINGGMLRGLAVSSRKRFMLAPDIPTIAETLPGLEVMSWLRLAAPGGTPRPVIDRLNWEVGGILKLQDIRDKLAIVGNIPMPSTPEQMQDYIKRDAARWSRVVDIKGIEKY